MDKTQSNAGQDRKSSHEMDKSAVNQHKHEEAPQNFMHFVLKQS